MTKILLVEDNIPLAESIASTFAKETIYFTIIHNGKEGFQQALKKGWDLIILDIELPGKSGLEILSIIRNLQIDVPVLMLTRLSTVEDLIKGLAKGADGYLAKPFSMRELQARVHAILSRPPRAKINELAIGELILAPDDLVMYYQDQKIPLRKKEAQLLAYLMKHPNRVISRDEILSNVWDIEEEPYPSTVDVHISNIRKKLHSNNCPEILSTARGIGFQLVVN